MDSLSQQSGSPAHVTIYSSIGQYWRGVPTKMASLSQSKISLKVQLSTDTLNIEIPFIFSMEHFSEDFSTWLAVAAHGIKHCGMWRAQQQSFTTYFWMWFIFSMISWGRKACAVSTLHRHVCLLPLHVGLALSSPQNNYLIYWPILKEFERRGDLRFSIQGESSSASIALKGCCELSLVIRNSSRCQHALTLMRHRTLLLGKQQEFTAWPTFCFTVIQVCCQLQVLG